MIGRPTIGLVEWPFDVMQPPRPLGLFLFGPTGEDAVVVRPELGDGALLAVALWRRDALRSLLGADAGAGAGGSPAGAAVRLTLKGGLLRGGTMIKVRTLTGKEIEIDIDLTDTMQRVKERVEEKEGIPPVQQRLIFAGKQMNDDKTAKDYNIEGGSVLHLVLALRGGS